MSATRYPGGGFAGPDVLLADRGNHLVLDNGIVQLTLTKQDGLIAGVAYGGIDNVLESENSESYRGYWDLDWNGQFLTISASKFSVVANDSNRVEVSFVHQYFSNENTVPLDIDKRFVLLRGSSGFYTYAILEKQRGWPAFSLDQLRTTFKLRDARFHFMAVADDIQRLMPTSADTRGCEALAYKEACHLTNPVNPDFRGEVDDKYMFTQDDKDGKVHGWISSNPLVGFWIIMPSNEFRNGGPTKRNLVSHSGPTSVAMYQGEHYGGRDLILNFQEDEEWKKVFGPIFVYLNEARQQRSLPPRYLWEDARQQMFAETEAWPYEWPASSDFLKARSRGTIVGRLLVNDKYAPLYPAFLASIGVASPGEPGSWQTEGKGYQFWSQADGFGYFRIPHIIPGLYNLYAFVPGLIGDYMRQDSVTVDEGSFIDLGELIYEPPRNGPTIWEIGIPERTAEHFLVPEVDPQYRTYISVNSSQRYRQYGLWDRYTQLYPEQDLVYTVGESDWRRDWYYMHSSRMRNGSRHSATWQIRFRLVEVIQDRGAYMFRIALAASHSAALQVSFNSGPVADNLLPGRDNAIARHGNHGVYHLTSVAVQPKVLRVGDNTVYITQRKCDTSFNGVMYDYLRLEAPSI